MDNGTISATLSAKTHIYTPNFTAIFGNAIKGAIETSLRHLPGYENGYLRYYVAGAGLFILLLFLFFLYKNFLR